MGVGACSEGGGVACSWFVLDGVVSVGAGGVVAVSVAVLGGGNGWSEWHKRSI